MNEFLIATDGVIIVLLLIIMFSLVGLIITIALYFAKKSGLLKRTRKHRSSCSRTSPATFFPNSDDIKDYGTNEVLSSGEFSAAERSAEYRRRGKSPSGVIDGVYNDAFRGNDSYNDSYRDWDADA